MLKNNIVLLVLILLLGNDVFSQQTKLVSQEIPELKYNSLKGEVYNKEYRQVQGEAYLSSDWATGDIYLSNGKSLLSVKYKFDAYQHHLIVYNEFLRRIVKLERDEISSFTLEDEMGIRYFKRVQSDRALKLGNREFLMEVLADEKSVSFYKLYYRDKIALRAPQMPYIDEFVPAENYYILYLGKYHQVRLRKNSLISQFPQYKQELKTYIRSKKLKLRSEHDFSEAVIYIDQLLLDNNYQ